MRNDPRNTLDRRPSPPLDPLARVRRNFWILVAATTIAVGLLSVALRQPPGPTTGLLTALSSLAAVTTLALAGRILIVTTMKRRSTRR